MLANHPLPPPPSDGAKDKERLVWMLETIEAILFYFVYGNHPDVLEFHMQSRFLNRWGEVEKAIENSIAIIKKEPPDPEVFKKLDEVGMTKEMLALKTASLSGCVDGLYREVNTGSPILSMKWLKPTMKCMNTIMFSLSRAIPGIEIAKEFKDHLEVAVDVAEAKRAK